MEKFVIDGGVPLSGTITPAGNKNAALPILAACVLTEDEVVLHNVPQIRDVEAMLELLEGWAYASSGAATRGRAVRRRRRRGRGRRPGASPSASAPRSCSPARCWRASAAPSMPPPGRRRDRPPAPGPAPRRLPRARRRRFEHDRDIVLERARGRPARRRRLHGRAVRHGDRERADGRGADARRDHDRQRGLRAARPGPRADARRRWARASTGIGSNVLRVNGHARAGRLRARRSAPTTSRSARSWRSPA